MIGYIITAIIAFIAGTIFSCYFDVEIKDKEAVKFLKDGIGE